MTKQNKLSRREAIKILGAATGASLLANVPAKWSRPEVTGSQLPAFAQTSCSGPLTIASMQVAQPLEFTPPANTCGLQFFLFTQLSDQVDVPLVLQTSAIGNVTWYTPDTSNQTSAPDGTYNSGNAGAFAFVIKVAYDNTVTFTMSFLNASDGCGSQSAPLSCIL